MNLSLSRKYKGDEIMVLGRWKSMAFLAYIHPQALEWTTLMARDMAKPRNFLDLAYRDLSLPINPGKDDDDDMGIIMTPAQRRRR
jgi:hypothetical protein